MKFSNTVKTVLKIYQKYVRNSVWFATGCASLVLCFPIHEAEHVFKICLEKIRWNLAFRVKRTEIRGIYLTWLKRKKTL